MLKYIFNNNVMLKNYIINIKTSYQKKKLKKIELNIIHHFYYLFSHFLNLYYIILIRAL